MRHLDSLLGYVHGLFPKDKEEEVAEEQVEEQAPNPGRTVVEALEGFGYSTSKNIHWCFMTADFQQASKFTTCRDYLNDSMLAFLTDDTSSYYTSKCLPIDLDKLRLLFRHVDKEAIESGLRAINAYSRLAGWEEARGLHCKIFGSDKGKWFDLFLIEADANWMRYPQLVSLLTLFVRLGKKKLVIIPEYIKTAYELEGFFHESVDGCARWVDDRIPDLNYLAGCYKLLITIFSNEKEIFKKLEMKAWKKCYSFHNRSGIYSFIKRSDTTHKAEAKTLKALYESEVLAYERGKKG